MIGDHEFRQIEAFRFNQWYAPWFDQRVRLELSGERKRIFGEVLKDIESVVGDYGERNGYEYIFHDSALLYKNEKYDVTADVLAELNNQYRKERE